MFPTYVLTDPSLPQGFRLTKLPPNGPKPGQSVYGWLYGKDKAHARSTEINQKP